MPTIMWTTVILSLIISNSAFELWKTKETAELLDSNRDPTDYGVDYSFPIHGYIKSNSYFKKRYEKMMSGCYEKFSRRECDGNELARMEMNKNQPKTQHNYTEIGFKKMRVPEGVWKPLIDFYNKFKDSGKKLENWPRGNTYVNNWESPTYMISLEDSSLRGGQGLKQHIWSGIKPIIEEWTGKKLKETSLYGIRVYEAGAVLATHVDRLPLVSSCIIQVAQDLNEPWPVEVYSHAGKAYNVTMEPGDMTLYESHTVLHGRPFPLNGTLYANIFVHFIPVDHDEENTHDLEMAKDMNGKSKTSAEHFGDLLSHVSGVLTGKRKSSPQQPENVGGHEQDNHKPEELERHMDVADQMHQKEKLAIEIREKESRKLHEKQVERLMREKLEARQKTSAEEMAMHKPPHLKEMEERHRLAKEIGAGLTSKEKMIAMMKARDLENELARKQKEAASSLDAHEEGDEEGDREGEHGEEEGEEEEEEEEEEGEWTHQNWDQEEEEEEVAAILRRQGRTALHLAAGRGELEEVIELLKNQDTDLLHARDINNWQAVHEAARFGNLDVLMYLVKMGADLSAKTFEGGTPLWWANRSLPPDHPIIKFLKSINAPDEGDLL